MAAHARLSKRQVRCRRCERHVDECGPLTWQGQCMTCAEERLVTNIQQLRGREGDHFERWRSGLLRSVQNL